MKITMGILSLAFYFIGQSAYACSNIGLRKDQVFALMTEVEDKIKTKEELNGAKALVISWANIITEGGAEGDCQATALRSVVTVAAKNSDGKYCVFMGPAEIFKSDALGSTNSVTLAKETYCLWE